MTHHYGRHGNKAWLRWREKRFRRVSLTLAPQVAVLHVPLEFLSRIRKVTILMNDGTEEIVEVTTDLLPPPIVDAVTKKRLNGSDQMHSSQDKFYAAAKDIAIEQAERIFNSTSDPYGAKPDVQRARTLAQIVYYGNDHSQLAQQWRFTEAQENFIREFKAEFEICLYQLSREYEASTEETQQLLVFARTDKLADGSYEQDRALARAYISLFSRNPLRQEDINEHVLSDLRKRVGLYQKFYDEFEPAKEED